MNFLNRSVNSQPLLRCVLRDDRASRIPRCQSGSEITPAPRRAGYTAGMFRIARPAAPMCERGDAIEENHTPESGLYRRNGRALWRVQGQKQPCKDSDCLSCAKISEPSGKLRWRVRVNRADFRIVSRRKPSDAGVRSIPAVLAVSPRFMVTSSRSLSRHAVRETAKLEQDPSPDAPCARKYQGAPRFLLP